MSEDSFTLSLICIIFADARPVYARATRGRLLNARYRRNQHRGRDWLRRRLHLPRRSRFSGFHLSRRSRGGSRPAIASNLIGVIAAQLGLHDEAIGNFERALACDPPFPPAKDNLQKIRNARARAARPQAAQGRRFLLIKAWGYGFWSDVTHVLGCL